MKKILFITSNFMPSSLTGSEEFIRKISTNLKNTYDVTVLTHIGKEFKYIWNPFIDKLPSSEKIEGVNIVRLEVNHAKNFVIIFFKILTKLLGENLFRKFFGQKFSDYISLYIGPQFIGLENFLSTNSFDFIHVGPLPYEYLIHTNNLHKKLNLKSKLLCTPFFHETQKVFYLDLFKRFMKDIDFIHVVTNYEKDTLVKKMNVDSNKITTIPLFLNLREYSTDSALEAGSQELRKRLDIKEEDLIILGIGDSRKDAKGIEYTISALNNVSIHHKNICLITIGGDYSLNQFFLNSDIKIINLGHISDMKRKEEIFNICDIFCMPSQIESFGLVYLEAWIRKKPVIAFDLAVSSEILSEGALLAANKDVLNLASKLEILINSATLRKEIGSNGYRKLVDFYSLDKVLKIYSSKLFS
jgi:glycosyltransferase involved in cell wall biosynthesis